MLTKMLSLVRLEIVVRVERGTKTSRFRVSMTRNPLLRRIFASLLAVSSASTFSGAPESGLPTAIKAAVPGVDNDRAELPGALSVGRRAAYTLRPPAKGKRRNGGNGGDLWLTS